MGTQSPSPKGGGAPKFSAHVYYSYCGFVRTLHSRYWFVQVQVLVLYAFYFQKKSLIILSLFQYKYWSKYLSCGWLQWEQMGVESLNFPTLCVRRKILGSFCETTCQVIRLLTDIVQHHTTPQPFYEPFFRDRSGELVPQENFWTLWCKGRLTAADTLTIRLGATPSWLSSAHLHHFLQARCPSCLPTKIVKALKATSAFGLGRRR